MVLLTVIGGAFSFQGYKFLVNGIYVNAYYNNSAFAGLTGTGSHALKQADYYIRYGLNDVTLFSDFLYTSHAPLFLLSSMVLLAAMIGTIVVAVGTVEPIDENTW